MKKSRITAAVLAAITTAGLSTLSANAAPANTSNYIQTIVPEVYALTAEEAASGEAVIPVSVYIKGTTDNRITVSAANCQILANETSYTYMRDQLAPNLSYNEQTYTVLGEEFTTKYRPFCFGSVSKGKYSNSTFLSTIRDYCTDRVEGNTIYYNGNDTVKVKISGRVYVNEEGVPAPDSVSHELICPLTVNEDGSASYSFLYADKQGTETTVAMSTGIIPYYQPETLEVGDMIPDINNLISWIGNLDGAKFLGNSDDFPLMETTLRFKNNTPCGIYNITSNQEYCNISATESGTMCDLPLEYRNAAIAVGVESASISTSTLPEYAFFYSHDNKIITAGSIGGQVLADISYTDGSSEDAKNITGAVNANVTPASLFDGSSTATSVTLYCGDTELIRGGSTYIQNVMVGAKGDANLDGTVAIDDAAAILAYYAKNAAGIDASLTDGKNKTLENFAFFLSDINTQSRTGQEGGALTIDDAADILSYYASTAAGITLSWDKFLD